jgi:hypothetical protein
MERRRSASQLKIDDLPTFGRPTIATFASAIALPVYPSVSVSGPGQLGLISQGDPIRTINIIDYTNQAATEGVGAVSFLKMT